MVYISISLSLSISIYMNNMQLTTNLFLMSTFHTQSLFQLVSTRIKGKPLVENAVLSHTGTKKLVHPSYSIKPYRDALFCFCFKLILSLGSVKLLF